MVQTVAVIRATLTATGAASTDFTKASFGTPTAAIIILCNAASGANPITGAAMSVGFWDGANQRVISNYMVDNVADSQTDRFSDDSYGAVISTNGGIVCAYTVSAITDGIRLTLSVDNTAGQRFCTVLLLSGVSAKAGSIVPGTTQNSTANSASLGFAPKLIFFADIVGAAADTNTTTAALGFGFAEVAPLHRSIVMRASDAAAAEEASAYYSETRVGMAISASAYSWGYEVTTFGADTFTLTSRDGAPGSRILFFLALGGADLSYDVGSLSTPTATGDAAIATDITPAAVLLAVSTIDELATIEVGVQAEGLMLGMGDANGQFSHNYSLDDAATTMSTDSAAQAAQIVDLDDQNSGTRRDLVDATLALNANDFTLSYSVVAAIARRGFWVAFSQAAAGGVSIPVAMYHYQHHLGSMA